MIMTTNSSTYNIILLLLFICVLNVFWKITRRSDYKERDFSKTPKFKVKISKSVLWYKYTLGGHTDPTPTDFTMGRCFRSLYNSIIIIIIVIDRSFNWIRNVVSLIRCSISFVILFGRNARHIVRLDKLYTRLNNVISFFFVFLQVTKCKLINK